MSQDGDVPPGQSNPPPAERPAHRTGKLKWRWAGEIEPNFWEPGLIDGLVEHGAMWIMYGASGSGKTAVAVDVAGHVACGRPWRNHPVEGGLVIYVAAENAFSTKRRVWAWAEEHKVDRDKLPLVVVESPMTVGKDSVGDLVALVAEIRAATNMEPQMVVLDTLARTMAGEENSTQDMGEYVKWVDTLRDMTSAAVCVVHHTGKDESRGARGSSALKAATDHEWEVFKVRGSPRDAPRGVRMSKIREGDEEGNVYGFVLKGRELGINRQGRKVTSPVAHEAEAPREGGGGNDELGALVVAYARAQGRVTMQELRDELGNASNGKPDAERKAWGRLVGRYLKPIGSGFFALRNDDGGVTGQDTP